MVIVAVGSALVVLFAGASIVLANGHQVPTELWAAAGALSGALVAMLVPSGGSTVVRTQAAAQTAGAHTHREAVMQAEKAAKPFVDAATQGSPSPEAKLEADAATAAVDEVRAKGPPLAATQLSMIGRWARSPSAAAAGAAAAALQVIQEAANGATADERTAKAPPDHREVDPHQVARASTRRKVLDAAVGGATQAQADSHATGIKAAGAPVSPIPAAVELKVALSLLIGALAFAAGIILALQVGPDTSKAITAYDTAVTNAADTLIALGSAAIGAALGLKAPSPLAG